MKAQAVVRETHHAIVITVTRIGQRMTMEMLMIDKALMRQDNSARTTIDYCTILTLALRKTMLSMLSKI